MHVAIDAATLVVEVCDDGRGLDSWTTRRSGLENLGERARRHGGSCEADPNGAAGTVLRWTASLAG